MQYLIYMEDAWANVSTSTHLVVFGFSIISVFFMKERIGTGAAMLYFPIMVGCAFMCNFIFWHFELFSGDQDLELVFTATIVGMIFSLLPIIIINNLREYFRRMPLKNRAGASQAEAQIDPV